MGEANWEMFTKELATASKDWTLLGPLVDEYNERIDDFIAASSSDAITHQSKEKEFLRTRERLRSSLVNESERFTRLIAILETNINAHAQQQELQQQQQQQQQLQQQQPPVSRPVPTVASTSGVSADVGQDESRGKQRSRSRTPQPSAKQGRYEYSSRKIQPGDQVAALVDKQWIIANVEQFDEARKRFRVRDPEPTEGKNDIFWVPIHHVLPFYDWENDPSAPTFAPGTTVLAVWPESTELYPGVIIEPPYRGPHRGDLPPLHYSVEFENSDGQHTPVPANQVVLAPSD